MGTKSKHHVHQMRNVGGLVLDRGFGILTLFLDLEALFSSSACRLNTGSLHISQFMMLWDAVVSERLATG